MKNHAKTGGTDLVLWALLLAGTAALAAFPREAAAAAKQGLILCAGTVIPALFPFLVLSSLTIELGGAEALGRLLAPAAGRLFHLTPNAVSAFVLGLLGGYPVGARTARQLCEQHLCSREEGEHLLLFCNNCGPAFILGAAGAGVFGSARAGLLLLGVHMGSAALLGFFLRTRRPAPVPHAGGRQAAISHSSPAAALTCAVRSGTDAVLAISAYVVLFSVMLAPVQHLPGPARCLLLGFGELSNGICSLPALESRPAALIACAAMLGWGGFSVQCQTLAMLEGGPLRPRNALIGKALHGVLSATVMAAILLLAPGAVPAWAVQGAAPTAALPPAALAGGMGLVLCLLALLFAKEHRKSVRRRV